MRRLLVGVMACVLTLAMAVPAGAAQDIRGSKKAKNFNFGVTTAVDPESGAILVVWTELKPADSSYARVWAALLKRKKNGTYKRKRDVPVSPKRGYHINAHVAWVKEAKTRSVCSGVIPMPVSDTAKVISSSS